ncbi:MULTISPECIES: hypothetical protein [Halorussus]|uniref:hypothetical protein n=1 Tax=Halorussus TaxID=1070314 RepID=UPI00209FAFEB|nr:hypothetical protein [Halorussus vallis]USZ76817.1 hypothetical protein NGM07_05685 [Halorussus vallis]
MTASSEPSLAEVTFDELESVDQYEATFTGALDDQELTLTYTVESAIGADDQTVYTPGDAELDHIVVQPDTYEFETDDRETVRFTATDDDGEDLFVVYVFAEAEDADENAVGLSVDSES